MAPLFHENGGQFPTNQSSPSAKQLTQFYIPECCDVCVSYVESCEGYHCTDMHM